MTLELLTQWSDRLAAFAHPMLVQSSIVIVVLLLIELGLRRHLRAAVRYAILLLILLKLVLPPGLASPTSVAYWFRSPRESKLPIARSADSTFVHVFDVPSTASSQPLRGESSKASPWPQLAFGLALAWLAGALALLVCLSRRSYSVRRLLARAAEPDPRLAELFAECQDRLGLRRRVQIRLSASASGPAVCGLLHPTVLLPRRLTATLSTSQLSAVLLHELIHVRRGDVWANCAQSLLQIVYWWHPLVWIANARIRRVREEAVDDVVMLALDRDAESYPDALLAVAKSAVHRPGLSLGLIGILESRSALRQRIHRLLDRPLPRCATLRWSGGVVVGTCASLLLPMAQATAPAEPVPPAPATARPPAGPTVMLECRLLEVSPEAWTGLKLGSPTTLGANGHQAWVLTADNYRGLTRRFGDLAGIETLSQPRVITASGNTATISMTRATLIQGRPIHLGTVCELTPTIRSTGIEVALKATFSELAPSLPEGYVQHLIADLSVSAPNAGGILLRNPTVAAGRERQLVIAVKPVILMAGGGDPEATREAKPTGAPSRQSPPDIRDASSAPRPFLSVEVTAIEPFYILDGQPMSLEKLSDAFAREAISSRPRGVQVFASPLMTYESVFALVDAAAQAGLGVSLRLAPQGGPESGAQAVALETRIFKVSADTLLHNLRRLYPNSGSDLRVMLRAYLELKGGGTYPPNQFYFNLRNEVLMIRADSNELAAVEAALEVINRAPPQVTIETKFIEAPDSVLATLDAGTFPAPSEGSVGTARILSAAQVRQFLQAMEKTAGSDLMAAPKVTTLSGRQAQIQIVDVKTITMGIHPAALLPPDASTPSLTNAFFTEQVPLGPTLDVIPQVADDLTTVELTAIAKLEEFVGYEDPDESSYRRFWVDGEERTGNLQAPRFRIRRLLAKARLYDGQTLLLTGPEVTEEVRQAQRETTRFSATEAPGKRLLVLVTPTVVDPAGNPIHTPGQLPFASNQLPPQ